MTFIEKILLLIGSLYAILIVVLLIVRVYFKEELRTLGGNKFIVFLLILLVLGIAVMLQLYVNQANILQ